MAFEINDVGMIIAYRSRLSISRTADAWNALGIFAILAGALIAATPEHNPGHQPDPGGNV